MNVISISAKELKEQQKNQYQQEISKQPVFSYPKINEKAISPGKNKIEIDKDEIYSLAEDEEQGAAKLYIALFKNKRLFDWTEKEWYYFRYHWEKDIKQGCIEDIEHVSIYLKDAKKQFMFDLSAPGIDKDRAKEITHKIKKISLLISKLNNLTNIKKVLSRAASGTEFSIGYSGLSWDQNRSLIAYKNGVYDIKERVITSSSPDDYIKSFAPVEIKTGDETCPIWEGFIDSVFEDTETAWYFQKLLGYGISGIAREEILPIFYGEFGANGKTTISNILSDVLGPLSFSLPPDFLIQKKNSSADGSTDSSLMSLKSKRLVWCSEINDGQKLNVAKAKSISGGDKIAGRDLFEKHKEFRPTHLAIILTNNMPYVPARDSALWRRLVVIPFDFAFVDEPKKPHQRKINRDIADEIKNAGEYPGILMWLIRGLIGYQEDGLAMSSKIKTATNVYRSNSDVIGNFLVSNMKIDREDKNLSIERGELFDLYVSWCNEEGHKPKGKIKFFQRVNDFSTGVKRYYNQFLYIGIGRN